MKKYFCCHDIRELGDTDKCRFVVLYGDRSTRIRYDSCHDISIVSIASDARDSEISRYTCDYDFRDSLFF